jgi:hypothetical protein
MPVHGSSTHESVNVTLTTRPTDWWRRPSASLLATAAGFVLVLIAVFALPWMRVGGGFIRFELSYKQMQDLLSATDSFSRLALDLGPLILLADLIMVGLSLTTRGSVGREALAAPIGLACLVLYVMAQIYAFGGTPNDDAGASVLGLHTGTGWGPWVCLLGCACLVAGAIAGRDRRARSAASAPRLTTSGHRF